MKTEAKRLYPFVPSGKDFEGAIVFFSRLGFTTEWRHPGLAGLRFGQAYFILQQIDIPEWQSNQMITYEVSDLDLYADELKEAGIQFRGPVDFPWGREIHLIDPAGVCWHIR